MVCAPKARRGPRIEGSTKTQKTQTCRRSAHSRRPQRRAPRRADILFSHRYDCLDVHICFKAARRGPPCAVGISGRSRPGRPAPGSAAGGARSPTPRPSPTGTRSLRSRLEACLGISARQPAWCHRHAHTTSALVERLDARQKCTLCHVLDTSMARDLARNVHVSSARRATRPHVTNNSNAQLHVEGRGVRTCAQCQNTGAPRAASPSERARGSRGSDTSSCTAKRSGAGAPQRQPKAIGEEGMSEAPAKSNSHRPQRTLLLIIFLTPTVHLDVLP